MNHAFCLWLGCAVFYLPQVALAADPPANEIKTVPRGSTVQVYSSALDTTKSIQVTLSPDKNAAPCDAGEPMPILTVASTSSLFSFSIPFEARFCTYKISAVQVPASATAPALSVSPAYLRVTDQAPIVLGVVPKVLLADSPREASTQDCSAVWTFLGPDSLRGNADYDVRFNEQTAVKCGTDPKQSNCYSTGGSTDGHIQVCFKGSTILRDYAGKQTVTLVRNGVASAPLELRFIPASSTTPRNYAIVLTALLIAFLYFMIRTGCSGVIRKIFGKQYLLTALFLDEQTQTYSLSKCQFYAWTFASVLGYIYFAISRSIIQNSAVFPEIPGGLPAILLFSGGTAVLTAGIVSAKGNKGAGEVQPSLGDFITTGGVVAPERLQFVVWTVVGICTFLTIVFQSDPVSISDLPQIPSGFLQLMGISSAGYLAGKLARKAGPNISAVDALPAAQFLQFNITGSGLSQNAIFTINGESVAPEQLLDAHGNPGLPEIVQKDETNNEQGFARMLRVRILNPKPNWLGNKNLTVTNPDAQKAVWPYDTAKANPALTPHLLP